MTGCLLHLSKGQHIVHDRLAFSLACYGTTAEVDNADTHSRKDPITACVAGQFLSRRLPARLKVAQTGSGPRAPSFRLIGPLQNPPGLHLTPPMSSADEFHFTST